MHVGSKIKLLFFLLNWSQILAANCKNEIWLSQMGNSLMWTRSRGLICETNVREKLWVIHTFSCHIISHILVHSLRAINRSGLRTDGLLLSTFFPYVVRFDNHPPRSQWWSYCFQKYHMNCVISMSSLVSQKAYPANSQCCEFPCDYEDSIGEHKHNCELKSLLFVEFYFFFSPLWGRAEISASNNQQRQPDWVLCIPQENKQMKPLFEGHTLLFLRHKKGAIFSVLLLIDHSEFDSKRFQWYCCVIINSRYV